MVIYGRQLLGGFRRKQSQSVTYTGATHFLHSQGSQWDLREADGCMVFALIGHHEAHQGGCQQAGFQATVPEQVVVDNSVEVAVVHSVVHVAILVVVLPPGLDGQEVPIGLQLPVVILGSLIG